MNKEKDIIIRVTSELKNDVELKAKSIGLSVSAYVRTIIIRDLHE